MDSISNEIIMTILESTEWSLGDINALLRVNKRLHKYMSLTHHLKVHVNVTSDPARLYLCLVKLEQLNAKATAILPDLVTLSCIPLFHRRFNIGLEARFRSDVTCLVAARTNVRSVIEFMDNPRARIVIPDDVCLAVEIFHGQGPYYYREMETAFELMNRWPTECEYWVAHAIVPVFPGEIYHQKPTMPSIKRLTFRGAVHGCDLVELFKTPRFPVFSNAHEIEFMDQMAWFRYSPEHLNRIGGEKEWRHLAMPVETRPARYILPPTVF